MDMGKIISRILSGIGLLGVAFVSILFLYSFAVALYEIKEITGWEFPWILLIIIVAYIIGGLLE